jgi:hypothetical protein
VVVAHQRSLFAGGDPALAPAPVYERIALDATSWVDLARGWLLGADALLDHLADSMEWHQGRRRMYDRTLDDPRLSCWFRDRDGARAIADAWFSGSMNYVGRARNSDGSPQYEATYEINASLEISIPEFQQLVSHEVVPGHVTTFAFLQSLYVDSININEFIRCQQDAPVGV